MESNVSREIRISVVIPCFNRRATLKRCLDSVMGQTFAAGEVIVVDDGSTDGTADWVSENFADVSLIQQENLGVSAARNAGIRNVRTEWIAFLDSDDLWLPEKLEKQVAALEEFPEYRVCHTEETWIYKGKEKPVAAPYRKRSGWIFKHCLPVCAISPSTALVHRSVFEELGVFDESLPACEDYDLWLRICSKMPVLLVDEPLIEKHGGHDDQLSSQRGLDRWRIQALRKILEQGQLDEAYRVLVINQLKEKCEIYARGLEKHGKSEEAEKYWKIGDGR